MACPAWSLLEDWYDSLRMVEQLSGLVPKTLDGGVCVPDTFREIALTSVVCKFFCHIFEGEVSYNG